MKKFLYDIFATSWYRGNSIWLYSDPHFNDPEARILRKNNLSDEEQIKRINSKVGKNDTIIFLGDIGDVNCIKKIRGYKVLVMGNHEKGASNYKRVIQIKENSKKCPICEEDIIYNEGKAYCKKCGPVKPKKDTIVDNHLFDEVYEGPLMVNDRLMLSHEPVDTPSFIYNIHGHDHSKWYNGDHHLNLCAEHINYTPVSLTALIKNGLLKNTETIHRATIDRAVLKKNKKENKENKNNADER